MRKQWRADGGGLVTRLGGDCDVGMHVWPVVVAGEGFYWGRAHVSETLPLVGRSSPLHQASISLSSAGRSRELTF